MLININHFLSNISFSLILRNIMRSNFKSASCCLGKREREKNESVTHNFFFPVRRLVLVRRGAYLFVWAQSNPNKITQLEYGVKLDKLYIKKISLRFTMASTAFSLRSHESEGCGNSTSLRQIHFVKLNFHFFLLHCVSQANLGKFGFYFV